MFFFGKKISTLDYTPKEKGRVSIKEMKNNKNINIKAILPKDTKCRFWNYWRKSILYFLLH